ncbi:hypothetical protein IWQ60_010921 [Tieghemiomyces parasiticus]|uniref:THO complex subunit 1 transcription elongation factor-domain-containing protein n=1 Tax=Tieghemiomyces parasiticus TaxID=78921 RepID=A0A9W7ZPH9_9FUNG|nr:hypothetical protein IWQ60_010921 [Tieghemiomyces parasiticus]
MPSECDQFTQALIEAIAAALAGAPRKPPATDGRLAFDESAWAALYDAHFAPLAAQYPVKAPQANPLIQARALAVDYAFRQSLAQLKSRLPDDAWFWEVEAFLDLILECESRQLVDVTLPLTLLEDLFESLPLAQAVTLFDYVEARRVRISVGIVSTSGKGQVLLRVCNELIRRCSLGQHAGFAGRVLVLIATVFPLTDRSGVNARGDFHTDKADRLPDDLGDISKELTTVVDSGKPSPGAMYASLRTLQRFFTNPRLLANNPDFAEFQQVMGRLIPELSPVALAPRKPAPPATAATNDELGVELEEWSPCLLLHPDLISLQLTDQHFCRQILVQALVILQYLSPTSTPSKFHLQITQERGEWVQRTRDRLWRLFEDASSGPGLDPFFRTVLSVLRHETRWAAWKDKSCPALVAPTAEALPDLLADYQKQAANLCSGVERTPLRFPLGTKELTMLWRQGDDHMADLRSEKRRRTVPDVQTYFFDSLKDHPTSADLEFLTEKEADVYQVQAWRGLRLAIRSHLTQFPTKPEDYIQRLRDTVCDLAPAPTGNKDEGEEDENDEDENDEEAEEKSNASSSSASTPVSVSS